MEQTKREKRKKCSFCEIYGIYEEIDRHNHEFPITSRAAIIRVYTIKGQKIRAGTNYIKNGLGAPLRYCPECGKKLKEKKGKSL